MITTRNIVESNKAAQKLGEQSRVAVDQAVVDARHYGGIAADQTVKAAKVAGVFAVAFVRSFLRK